MQPSGREICLLLFFFFFFFFFSPLLFLWVLHASFCCDADLHFGQRAWLFVTDLLELDPAIMCLSLWFKDFIGFSVAVLSSDIQLNDIDAIANCLYQVLFGAQEIPASLVPLSSSACFLVGGRAA